MFFLRDANDGVEGALDGARRSLVAARATAHEIGESTRLSFDALTDQFEDLRHPVLRQARLLAKSVSEKTEANPLLAAGMAFAAGVIVAKMFKRGAASKNPPRTQKIHPGI